MSHISIGPVLPAASESHAGRTAKQRQRRECSAATPAEITTERVAQNVKKRPINRAPFESVYVTEPRPEYPRCNACGRPYLRTSPAERFCSTRCAEYVPLPSRQPDGEWFIVAGPVDYCDGCGLAVTPRKPQGFLAPVRAMDGHLHCRECRPMRADRRVADDDAIEPIKR